MTERTTCLQTFHSEKVSGFVETIVFNLARFGSPEETSVASAFMSHPKLPSTGLNLKIAEVSSLRSHSYNSLHSLGEVALCRVRYHKAFAASIAGLPHRGLDAHLGRYPPEEEVGHALRPAWRLGNQALHSCLVCRVKWECTGS